MPSRRIRLAYLRLIKDHIAASLAVTPRDLTEAPFSEHGGLGRARQLFGADLDPLLDRTHPNPRRMNDELPPGWTWATLDEV